MKHSTTRLLSFAGSIALLLGSLIVFNYFIRPAYTAAQSVKAHQLSNQRILDEQKQKLSKVTAVTKAYQGNLAEVQSVTALALPPERDEADLVNQLSKLAGKYSLAVQNMTVNTPGAKSVNASRQAGSGGSADATSSLSQVKPVGVLNVQLKIAGSYGNFKQFLHDVETNIRIMDVAALAVTPVGKANQDFFAFDMTLVAYYQNP